MDLSFLPGLIAGGLLTLLTSVLTNHFSARREDKRREADHAREAAGQRDAVGQRAAEKLLEDLISITATSIDREAIRMGHARFAFDADQLRAASAHASLVTETRLREMVQAAMNAIDAVGPATGELGDVLVAQQSVMYNLREAVSAYLRHDELPEVSMTYVENFNKVVDDAWRTAAGKAGL